MFNLVDVHSFNTVSLGQPVTRFVVSVLAHESGAPRVEFHLDTRAARKLVAELTKELEAADHG